MQKQVNFFTSEDKSKPNTTEFSFFCKNGQHLRKHQKIKAKNTCKTNSKRGNLKLFSLPDEIIQRSERKMKVVHQKDDKNMAIILR